MYFNFVTSLVIVTSLVAWSCFQCMYCRSFRCCSFCCRSSWFCCLDAFVYFLIYSFCPINLLSVVEVAVLFIVNKAKYSSLYLSMLVNVCVCLFVSDGRILYSRCSTGFCVFDFSLPCIQLCIVVMPTNKVHKRSKRKQLLRTRFSQIWALWVGSMRDSFFFVWLKILITIHFWFDSAYFRPLI